MKRNINKYLFFFALVALGWAAMVVVSLRAVYIKDNNPSFFASRYVRQVSFVDSLQYTIQHLLKGERTAYYVSSMPSKGNGSSAQSAGKNSTGSVMSPITNHQSSIINHQSSITNPQSSITYNLSPIRTQSSQQVQSRGGGAQVVAQQTHTARSARTITPMRAQMASVNSMPVYAVNTGIRSVAAVPVIDESGSAVQPMAAAPHRAGMLPPPPVTDPDDEHQLGYEAPIGDAVLPLLLMALCLAVLRRRKRLEI